MSGKAETVMSTAGANIEAFDRTERPRGKRAQCNIRQPKATKKTARTIASNSGTALIAAKGDLVKAAMTMITASDVSSTIGSADRFQNITPPMAVINANGNTKPTTIDIA